MKSFNRPRGERTLHVVPAPAYRPFMVRKSAGGKFYVMRRRGPGDPLADLISTSHPTIDAAMRSIQKYIGTHKL